MLTFCATLLLNISIIPDSRSYTSKKAQKFSSKWTKPANLTNNVLAPHYDEVTKLC